MTRPARDTVTRPPPLSWIAHDWAAGSGAAYGCFADPSMNHVGLEFQPADMRTRADFPNLADALVERGYDEEEIRKLLGGNWLSLFDRVWKPS